MASEKIMEVMGWYHPHKPVNWTGEVVDPKTGELVKEPSLTKQSFVAECDINNIIKQYQVTGIVAHINEKAQQGMYVDLPSSVDFQEALNTVMAAQESFASLPSAVRNRFDNDPEKFLVFMADPENRDELVKLGLGVDKRPPAAPPPEPDKAPPPAPQPPAE